MWHKFILALLKSCLFCFDRDHQNSLEQINSDNTVEATKALLKNAVLKNEKRKMQKTEKICWKMKNAALAQSSA